MDSNRKFESKFLHYKIVGWLLPIVLMICGLPGVGKSTIARQLAPLINGVVISSDELRKHLFRKPKYTRRNKKLVYDILLLLAKYLYKANVNCILDATFSKEKFRHEVWSKLGLPTRQVHIIECVCPEDIVEARLNARKLDYSDADFSVYRKMKRMYEPVKQEHIKIDTSRISKVELRSLVSNILQRS
jgi:predicted kinase